MKKVGVGILLTITVMLVYRFFIEKDSTTLKESSMLIQQQIKHVSKLIVTEGHFSEVYNYKDSQELFGTLITANKKALVVVNAEVSIAYDLEKVVFKLEEETKTLYIESIPEPEIRMYPDFEYYDVTADYLNPFEADDYNTIKRNISASLLQKIEKSKLKSNAKNRLISELSKFYVLTNSLGWTLVYNEQTIQEWEELEQLERQTFID